MRKIMLTGVDGNLGSEAAKVLMELEDKDNLIFAGYNPDALKQYEDIGIETRQINLNDRESLKGKLDDVERIGLISMPFVGAKR